LKPENDPQDEFRRAFDADDPPEIDLPDDGLVAVVLAYNEALRFPHFLDFHRSIGVSHFLVVDNASNDGSAEFLDAQNDVTRFPTRQPYKAFKSAWRRILASTYLNRRWVYFPDVDELLGYPGWPGRSINYLLDHWSDLGVEGVFATMVDMYPQGPLKNFHYANGQPFLDACPFFDSDGYQFLPLKRKTVKRYPVPASQVYGGPRERLFPMPSRRKRTAFDCWLLDHFFSLDQPVSPNQRPGLARYLASRFVRHTFPPMRPVMSKIPLLKWPGDIRFSGGVHSLTDPVNLAQDWCTLLHFKYLDDFVPRTQEAVKRAQHVSGARHYRHYDTHKGKLMETGAVYTGSRRFRGLADLEETGLIRVSKSVQNLLSE